MDLKLNLSKLALMLMSILINHSKSSAALDLTSSFMNLDGVFTNAVQSILASSSGSTTADQRNLNTSELARRAGFPAEEYTVTCSGYKLILVHIPGNGSDVLLVHGLASSSDCYVCSGNNSLPFLLAAAGMNVWLLNTRGNMYSNKHENKSSDDPNFWNFSWHEKGTEDLPIVIDFILAKTNKTKLAYVGHSEGTTQCYVLLSTKPQYNNKISLMVSLAPICWISNMFSPLVQLMAANLKVIKASLDALKVKQFLPCTELTRLIVTDIFCISPFTAIIVDVFLFLIWGISFSQIDVIDVQNNVAHWCGGAAMLQLYHFLQLIKSRRFQYYDFDEDNYATYGSVDPPEYPVSQISCDMLVFFGRFDWFTSDIDIQKLTSQLPNLMGVHELPFNHQDFCWGKDAHILLYRQIIEAIQTANLKYSSVIPKL